MRRYHSYLHILWMRRPHISWYFFGLSRYRVFSSYHLPLPTSNSGNSCVPKTVRHGTSLHIIYPKLLIDLSTSRLESINTSPIWLESQTSVRLLTAKLFGSSPIRLESQASVRLTTLKLFGSNPSRLESSASVRQLSLKLFGSIPKRLSFGRRRNCWLTSQLSVPWPEQPLTTHVLDVCHQLVTETKMSPIVCTAQN